MQVAEGTGDTAAALSGGSTKSKQSRFRGYFRSVCSCLPFVKQRVESKNLGYLSIDSFVAPRDQPQTAANIAASLHKWNNAICTTQYTWWNFLFVNVGGQIIMPYNLYFIFLAIMQLIPSISDSGGAPTFLIPLVLVMGFTSLRDAHEDIQRQKADKKENDKSCTVFRKNEWMEISWKDLVMGDIVKIYADMILPADVILLSCSDSFGMAYMETKELDGETNLKTKLCISEISEHWNTLVSGGQIKFRVKCCAPTANLNVFDGSLEVLDVSQVAVENQHNYLNQRYSIQFSQFILRGSCLKNTEWLCGFVVYPGMESKIFKNLKSRKLKFSTLHRNFKKQSVILMILQMALCLLAAFMGTLREQSLEGLAWYLELSRSDTMREILLSAALNFFRFVLLLSYMVPISLLVQLQICRFFQSLFISRDRHMISRDEAELPAVHSASIIEELGCVSHVFSDKTGTLTKNNMQFRCLCVSGMAFGLNPNTMCPPSSSSNDRAYALSGQSQFVNFNTSDFLRVLESCDEATRHVAGEFMLCLALCHSVIPKNSFTMKSITVKENSPESDGLLTSISSHLEFGYPSPDAPHYDACSPDELALVYAVNQMGVQFLRRPNGYSMQLLLTQPIWESVLLTQRDQAVLTLLRRRHSTVHESGATSSVMGVSADFMCLNNTYEQQQSVIKASQQSHTPSNCEQSIMANGPYAALTFTILRVLEFDNTRKLMSVVVRDSEGQLKVYSKGADSSVLAIAAPGQEQTVTQLKSDLEEIASSGLRTLVMGYRLLEESEYEAFEEFSKRDVTSAYEDSQKELSYRMIETDLIILGCTGIEDELQEAVPDTIQNLKSAGLNLWVLTGDKLETAISIGYSTNILTDATYNAIVDGTTVKTVQEQLLSHMYCVVAAQLAGDFFDQFYESNESARIDEVSDDSAKDTAHLDEVENTRVPFCGICHPSGLRFSSCRCTSEGIEMGANKKRRRGMRPTMSLDDFVKLLRFSAKRRNVIADPQQVDPKSLTEQQLARIVRNYVNDFDPVSKDVDREKGVEEDLGGIEEVSYFSRNEGRVDDVVEGFKMCAVIVTGEALDHILGSSVCKRYFFALTNVCTTLIACRVSPKQKGDLIVEAKRFNRRMVSLAIGDGANDVAMLVSADVGVAVSSKEGYQAARAADFVIGEFRFIQNLLFYHGNENLRRNLFQVYHTVWKNVLFGTSNFFFGFASAFSSIDIFNSWLKQMFNFLFTTIPIMWYSVTDIQLSYNTFMKTPLLYHRGMAYRMYAGHRSFLRWLAYGLYAALVSTLLPFTILQSSNSAGGFSLSNYGTVVFEIVVLVCHTAVIPFVHTWNLGLLFLIVLDVLFWYLSYVVCVNLPVDLCYELKGSLAETHTQLVILFVFLISLCLTIFPQLYLWFYKVVSHPTVAMLLQRSEASKIDKSLLLMHPKESRLATIVRRKESNTHKGFAFSEQEGGVNVHRQISLGERSGAA